MPPNTRTRAAAVGYCGIFGSFSNTLRGLSGGPPLTVPGAVSTAEIEGGHLTPSALTGGKEHRGITAT